MSDDDTRGYESPDRRDESQQPTTYRTSLEAVDTHATILLEKVINDDQLESDARRAAKRHCRELRAELECLRRHLPETDERQASSDGRVGGITKVDGPFGALREASRRDDREPDDRREREDTSHDEGRDR
ncbi:hypothetical protein [Natrinema sp. SYSU A 869]|uniref:hypothetical protein n=1 Tax=Natrinema sp. SYSU A 869 TaxID=2871694 RepID=UPI001CA41BA9|nr:hypothetical protein [Natrinema sp. SYSU A 869]